MFTYSPIIKNIFAIPNSNPKQVPIVVLLPVPIPKLTLKKSIFWPSNYNIKVILVTRYSLIADVLIKIDVVIILFLPYSYLRKVQNLLIFPTSGSFLTFNNNKATKKNPRSYKTLFIMKLLSKYIDIPKFAGFE